MKTVFVSGLTILAAAGSLFLSSVAVAQDDACTPRLVQKETKFPLTSQMHGHEGTVLLNVVVDENGRAQRADLQRSSGHTKLDRAAARSAVNKWVFDVSSCERKDLPITHVVAVEYHNDAY